jgi:transcriptional regulator with XRE-family HTH domain
MNRPPAPLEWARRIVLSYGRRDGMRITIGLSQSELARREGVSTGTVAYYLDRLGRLVVSRRPIVLDAEALGVDEPPAARPDTTTLTAVLHAVAALQAAHAQLTAALAGLVVANDFADIREFPRELANGFANLRETEQTDSQIENYLTDSLTRERPPRHRDRRARRPPRPDLPTAAPRRDHQPDPTPRRAPPLRLGSDQPRRRAPRRPDRRRHPHPQPHRAPRPRRPTRRHHLLRRRRPPGVDEPRRR